MFLNPRPSGLCRLITQYLFTRSQWRLWGLFAIVLAAYAFNIKLAVLYNDWNGRFFNALQAVNRDAIFRELFYFIGLCQGPLGACAAPRPYADFLQTLAISGKRSLSAARERPRTR